MCPVLLPKLRRDRTDKLPISTNRVRWPVTTSSLKLAGTQTEKVAPNVEPWVMQSEKFILKSGLPIMYLFALAWTPPLHTMHDGTGPLFKSQNAWVVIYFIYPVTAICLTPIKTTKRNHRTRNLEPYTYFHYMNQCRLRVNITLFS